MKPGRTFWASFASPQFFFLPRFPGDHQLSPWKELRCLKWNGLGLAFCGGTLRGVGWPAITGVASDRWYVFPETDLDRWRLDANDSTCQLISHPGVTPLFLSNIRPWIFLYQTWWFAKTYLLFKDGCFGYQFVKFQRMYIIYFSIFQVSARWDWHVPLGNLVKNDSL